MALFFLVNHRIDIKFKSNNHLQLLQKCFPIREGRLNMNTQLKKPVVLLLLSGGKDSPEALRRLLAEGYEVAGLCIDGIQGKEKEGAQAAASLYEIDLEIARISFFDENTWNPFKLIARDLAMGVKAIRKAKSIGAIGIAAGVKKSDIENPLLWWLYPFLIFGRIIFWFCGLQLLLPVWLWDSKVNLESETNL
jgi:hypothetical protein